MKCKFCGASLSYTSAVCPNCGRLMSMDQMKERKEMNGANNAIAQRLNELNKNSEYRLNAGEKKNNYSSLIYVGVFILILVIILIIMIATR